MSSKRIIIVQEDSPIESAAYSNAAAAVNASAAANADESP
jgi:hypothetical protein